MLTIARTHRRCMVEADFIFHLVRPSVCIEIRKLIFTFFLCCNFFFSPFVFVKKIFSFLG